MRHAIKTRTESALQRLLFVAPLLLFIVTAACSDVPTTPSNTAVATVTVAGETFRVQLVGEKQIEAARAAQGGASVRIPNGRVVPGASVTSGWSWHLEDVEFVASAIELSDGRPSDIERQGAQFGGGRFCPWNAPGRSDQRLTEFRSSEPEEAL